MRIYLVFSSIVATCSSILAVDVPYCHRVEGYSTIRKDVVNLVYTMDSKCTICYEEANKLVHLKEKLTNFGINVNFIIGINQFPKEVKSELPPQLKYNVKDIWTTLGKNNGHAFVLDSCGRVAYQVIAPWSKQTYPYTTMAVLSAIFDKPCGACDSMQTNSNRPSLKQQGSNEHRSSPNVHSVNNVKDEVLEIPLWIQSEEFHKRLEGGQNVNYEYVELKLNNPKYHNHPIASGNEQFEEDWIQHEFDYLEGKELPKMFTEWRIINGKAIKIEKDETLNSHSSHDRQKNDNVQSEEGGNINLSDIQTNQTLKEHYEKLVKWKPCADLIMGNFKCSVHNRLCPFFQYRETKILEKMKFA